MKERGIKNGYLSSLTHGRWTRRYGFAATRKGKFLEHFATMPTTTASRGSSARTRSQIAPPQAMPPRKIFYIEENITQRECSVSKNDCLAIKHSV